MHQKSYRRTLISLAFPLRRNYRLYSKTKNRATKFRQEKESFTTELEKCLKLPPFDVNSVAPSLRSCLIQLNQLSFAFTKDSRGFLFRKTPKDELTIAPPKAKRFQYRAPFIKINLDGSKRSFEFWNRLFDLIHKYPQAYMSPPYPSTSFEIMPSFGYAKLSDIETLRSEELQIKVREAEKFFRDVERITAEFLKSP